MNRHACLAALLALAALALPASAKTYYVDAATGNDNNTGLKETLAFRTIQKAIDKAAAGSTILVAPGTYAPIRTAKKLTIKSTDGAESTIIDGSLGEKYVPAPVEIPEYVHKVYREWNDSYEYYYYTDESGNPIFGDPWEQGYDDYHYTSWYPPVDENIWIAPAPAPKTVKTKWGRYVVRTGEVRCTETCVLMGRMTHTVQTENDGRQWNFKNVSSVSASLSGFTLRGSTFGIVGGGRRTASSRKSTACRSGIPR